MKERHVEVDGVRLAVVDFGGSGRELVLLPGAGRTVLDVDLVAPLLAQHFHVVAVDHRGHGLSDAGPWSWDVAVSDLEAVAADLSLDRPAVVGHSLGGIVAAMWGARHPESLGVVNLDGHGVARAEQFDGLEPVFVEEHLARIRALEEQQGGVPVVLPEEALPDAARGLAASCPLLTHEQAVANVMRSARAVEGGYVTVDPGVAVALLRHLDAVDPDVVHRDCRARLLVVHASRSLPPPPGAPAWLEQLTTAHARGLRRLLRELAEDRPNVSTVEIDATHALLLEDPTTVADTVTEFLLGTGGGAPDA